MNLLSLAATLGFVALTLPIGALALLAVALLAAPQPVPEQRVHQLVGGSLAGALLSTLLVGLALLLGRQTGVAVDLGSVIAVRGYHLSLAFWLDGPAILFLTLDFLLCGLVGLFSARYLHRDPGYARFYFLLLLSSVGIAFIGAARGLDLLFAGWEMVGLSSALLIAFFHRRATPVVHGLRAYAVYRVTDVGLLAGLVLLHHALGSAALDRVGEVPPSSALIIGGLLIFGAMGKAAAVPFTGWLPRALEGPTPSSAIFYGALSIHASPFLLLRLQPLLDLQPPLRAAVVALGLLTAAHASMVGRVQPDTKNALGYASVAQVGLMWVWAGLGLEALLLLHIAGHAILRMWQLLRAPNVLLERHQRVSLLGTLPGRTGRHIEALVPASLRRRLYQIALERWLLDELLAAGVRLLTTPLAALDRLDAAAGTWLQGEPPRDAHAHPSFDLPAPAPSSERPEEEEGEGVVVVVRSSAVEGEKRVVYGEGVGR